MMKQLFTLALVVITAMTLLASNERSRVYTYDSQGRKTCWSADGQKLGTVTDAMKMPSKAPERLATLGDPKPLEIEIRYDENEYLCDCITAGQMDNNNFCISSPQKNLGIQNIPSGSSGMMCVFQKHDKKTGKVTYYVVAKNISELPDGSKVIFDIADCVHKVSYNPLGQDGNPINLSVTKESNREVIKTGDFEYAFYNITWNHAVDGVMWTAQGHYGRKIADDGTEIYQHPEVWFNDCGGDFTMGHYIIGSPQLGRDYTLMEMPVYQGEESTVPSDVVLSNNPTRFTTYSRIWTRSPYSVSQFDKLIFSTRLCVEASDISYVGIGSEIIRPCSDLEVETRINVCTNDPSLRESKLMSMILIDIMPENDSDSQVGRGSMWWRPSDSGRQYIPLNHIGEQTRDMPFETFCNFVEGNYTEWLNIKDSSNPVLAFDDNKVKGNFGNNTPIISLMPDPKGVGSDILFFYAGLVGRYGESDANGLDYLLEYEQSSAYDNNGFRTNVFSYDNVQIDGEIDGCVRAELSIKKGTEADDYIPPVMTHLGVRDVNGYLTDRFETARDGIVELYAADFYADLDWSLGTYGLLEYKCKPIPDGKLTVEYAPYGGSDFNKLPVTEVPEKYFYPGWGNFYTVPLESVSGKSSNGWFDLRVTMEDATGNKHVQTVSPAFRIADAAGIETVADDNACSKPVYYNLQGVRVDNPENGIFIERTGNRSRKVVM